MKIQLVLFLASKLFFTFKAEAAIEREVFSSYGQYLVVEFLDDDLVHFELSAIGPVPQPHKPLYTSPMVKKTDYLGPTLYQRNGKTFETRDLRVIVEPQTLAVTVIDKTKADLVLTTFSPKNLNSAWKGLNFTAESFTHAYGLGQKFYQFNQANGNLIGRKRESGTFGNVMSGWDGGATGDTQMPVIYFAGAGNNSYGLFMDNFYKQTWDFTQSIWSAEMWGDWLRWYVMTGDDLVDLRKDYLELTGTAPVPPKQAFGLWISEYGFDDWAEVDQRLSTLKNSKFPVDGVILDLQWYGGITNDDNTRMGSLTWDQKNFPNPKTKISQLKQQDGVSVMLIEQSSVGKNLASHTDLASRGFLAKNSQNDPVYLNWNPWWGKGGYIDWSNPNARNYWHQQKREPVIADGILGHWTDLGEPELYDSAAHYFGVQGDYKTLNNHGDIHNLYGFFWSQGIFEGYQAHGHLQRPWILARSGTSGLQRFGVSMWSGDIGANLTSLNSQLNTQMHLSMSGVDYYGSDIGGFHRQEINRNQLDELYTVWFAHSSLFDIPVRPHVNNLCHCNDSTPDRIGDVQANLENVRFRYEHLPYYYSLAHRAYQYGEAIFPPLVYHFQSDQNVRDIGDQKMIGKDLLVKTASAHGIATTDVYLPAGTWFHYRSHQWIESSGQIVKNVSTLENGKFKLPIFARSGAIIPQMPIDEQTANAMGKRRDGSNRNELMLKVFVGSEPSDFTLFEDNGQDILYQKDELRTTLLQQYGEQNRIVVLISPSKGSYAQAIGNRENHVQLITKNHDILNVRLNGMNLTRWANKQLFDAAASGWYQDGSNVFYAKSEQMHVNSKKEFSFEYKN